MNKEKNYTVIILLSGMAGGLMLALFSLLNTGTGSMPEAAVARIHDRFIGREDYARALSAVVSDSGQALTAEQRRRVLDRMIDEELLLQYGQDQGLVQSDRRVRATLVSAVLEAKSVEAETRHISDEEAQDFYANHRSYFSRPEQLRVTVLRFSTDEAAETARTAWAVQERDQDAPSYPVGGERLSHIPNSLLPLNKLRQLAGATLAEVAVALPPGEVSPVIVVGERPHLVRVEERVERTADFVLVVDAVKAEMRRRAAEASVREALDQLREQYEIVIAEERL